MTTDPALEIMENNPVPDWNAPPNAALTPSSSYLSMLGGGLPDLGVDSADLFLTHCPTPLDSGVPDGMEDAIMGYDVDLACPSTSSSTASPSYSSSKDFPDSAACTCVRILTSQVNCLHQISSNRSAAGLDEVLQCTQEAASFVSRFLQCHSCSVEVQIYVLVGIIFSFLLDLVLPLMGSSQESPRPRALVRVGNYTMPGQLGDVLERVAVRSMIGTLDKVMRKFEVKIDFLSSEKAHIEFLKSEVKRIKRGFALIIAQSSTVED
ncbi:hypothetical protein ARSEF1564_010035 [Beauveria bassiana]